MLPGCVAQARSSPTRSMMMQPAPRACPPSQPLFAEAVEQGLSSSTQASSAANPPAHELLDSGHARSGESPLPLQPTPVQTIPLRGRDLQVLTELFNQTEIEAIESDILQNLDWRCPEPCWEDDPFDFLREYL